jgi:hypothetical protein
MGCLPPLSDVEGKACDDARPCPDQLLCLEKVCRRTAPLGPPNPPELLFEDGFETGLSAWSATGLGRLGRVATPVHAGSNTCRLSSSDGAAQAYGMETVRTQLPVREGLYCVSAWVAHNAQASPVTLSLRRFGGAGGLALLAESPKDAQAKVSPDAGAGYHVARAALAVDALTTSAVVVALQAEASVGATSFIDDVALWVSFDGGCP